MERDALRRLLGQVRARKLGVKEALERLRHAPVDEIGFATVDLHRALRRGFPEVIYGPGKTTSQIVAIVTQLHRAEQTALVTRVGAEVFQAIVAAHPRAVFHETARIVQVDPAGGRRRKGRPGIIVISAGTSDIPVAEEAAVTAEAMGNDVDRIFDVGVAGLHRLLAHRNRLLEARVIVAVAGMEGALPSVVGGLVDCPVIGLPTSVGYGTGEGGKAALLAMLNSCAAGLTVVNVDNGFGAGFAAALINQKRGSSAPKK